MTTLLYTIVGGIARFHEYFLRLNDAYELYFTDKELHFLIIGLLGMAMVFVIHPIFKLLADSGHVMVITWIYVFTLILVITFAIEIGQGFSGTGSMDFDDIMFGVVGFLIMFVVFAVIREIFLFFVGLFTGK